MQGWLKRITKPSMDWLLVCLPIAAVLEIAHARFHTPWATPTLIFLTSALAIIPVAGWMGRATEHLAARLGEGIGGLLNATFGNAAELIIALIALIEGMRYPERMHLMQSIVKASLTGSIIGNVLLVLGLALLVGGIRYKTQSFNTTAARASTTLLTLATIALLVPAIFAYLVAGHSHNPAVQDISLELAILLLIAYALSLYFTLHTHKHLYVGEVKDVKEGLEEETHPWSVGRGIGVLVLATLFVAILAEFMIGSVESASKSLGLGELFVGVIVVAIVGNAAEHSTAVLVAWRNRMDLALSIAIGSSIQIALFVAPILLIISHLLGDPMNLIFTVPEIVAVGISVFILGQIAGDGESNWLEGALLLMVYVMLGILFFYLSG